MSKINIRGGNAAQVATAQVKGHHGTIRTGIVCVTVIVVGVLILMSVSVAKDQNREKDYFTSLVPIIYSTVTGILGFVAGRKSGSDIE
jgi:heme/copper-type cytochrome/quinol oxidase subunit 2